MSAAPMTSDSAREKIPGIAVVMITLNEAHNLEAALQNLQGWAEEIFIVDSYSSDRTVDIALQHGVHIVQRKFAGFGDQWNFALDHLPITSAWTMKLDPDERLGDELKSAIAHTLAAGEAIAYNIERRLWFMGRPLPVRQTVLRIWRTHEARFTDVLVNERPEVDGPVGTITGALEHLDSPDLHHWYEKQNRYSSAEAITMYRESQSGAPAQRRRPGTRLAIRMWVKRYFFRIPSRYQLLFLYHYLVQGAWRAGKAGYIWSRLRVEVYRAREYKLAEMKITGRELVLPPPRTGAPDGRVTQYPGAVT